MNGEGNDDARRSAFYRLLIGFAIAVVPAAIALAVKMAEIRESQEKEERRRLREVEKIEKEVVPEIMERLLNGKATEAERALFGIDEKKHKKLESIRKTIKDFDEFNRAQEKGEPKHETTK